MPAIQRSAPQHPAPIEILKHAIAASREHDITVRVGPPGVVCGSTYGPVRWELDPRDREPVVDPIGAVLLAQQPPACDIPDAACQALGVNRAWYEGLCDGMVLDPKDARWLACTARATYLHGYESGALLRIHVQSYAVRA